MEVESTCEELVGNKQVIFKAYVDGSPKVTDMEVKTGGRMRLKAPAGSGSVLLKNLHLSCDPYMRGRMRNFFQSHIPPFIPGSPMEGYGLCQVVDSDHPNFKRGDCVTGMTRWEEYSLIHDIDQLRKIQDDHNLPLSYYVGVLGMPGFTAYAGLHELCSPKEGDGVLVSAAAGAVGQLVGQLAKLQGCYVVGSAGSGRKVDLLKNELGFDHAFNYTEEPNLDEALKRYFPKGVDIYFDNVGGPMLDAALLNMNAHGRIAVCGMVSQHSLSNSHGIHNLYNLVFKRVRMEGFLQSDFLHLFPRFLNDVVAYLKQGKIVYIEDFCEGLDAAPAALVGLFEGKNVGKQVVRVSTN